MQTILSVCAGITAVAAAAAVAAKLALSVTAIRKGQQCLLRQQMLETYYNCKQEKKIRQYRYENFVLSYRAYKALGGNSFIDKIYEEIKEWEVIS